MHSGVTTVTGQIALPVMTVTSVCVRTPYHSIRKIGAITPQPTGDGTMSWRKSTIFAVDCAAVLAGVLIAAPFVLILTSPFLASY